MKTRAFLAVNALTGLVFGLGFLVIPQVFFSLLGLEASSALDTMARIYGAELIGFNIATWLAVGEPAWRRPVIVGHAFNESLDTVLLVMAVIGGVANTLTWGLVAVTAVFAAGYLWLASRPADA